MGWSAFRPVGLTHHNRQLSVKGYTLFAPSGNNGLYLIDMDGKICMHWQFADFNVSYAEFRPNGNLMLTGVPPATKAASNALAEDDFSNIDLHCLRLGGGYTSIREYDWDANLIWQYDHPRLHHDFHVLENGDVLLPQWVVLDADFAATVAGGYAKYDLDAPMMGDDIIRINCAGEEVGRWHTWQMLDSAEDGIAALQGRKEWTHLNSVDLMPDGNIIVSCRNISRVFIFDPNTSEIVWKLGDPAISLQHSATPVPGGNVQIFDNGMHRPMALPYSQILEYDPATSKQVWCYKPPNSEQFFSGHISNAQRLAHGNVFICEGTSGRFFEITRQGNIVWEWICPIHDGNDQGRIFNWVYRANRFPASHAAFAGRDLDPANYHNLNTAYNL